MSANSKENGKFLYREGRYSDALESFSAAGIEPSEDLDTAYFMSLCYARVGKLDAAMELLGQVSREEKNLVRLYQVRMLLSWLLVETDNIEEAEKQLKEVLAAGFESPQAWSALAYCQWRQNDIELALKSYQEALKLDEENPNAVNGLGYILAESGKDTGRAIELCRRALESNPGSVAYRDSLGWALFRAGKTSEAAFHLTEAHSSCPEDSTIRSHLEAVKNHANLEGN